MPLRNRTDEAYTWPHYLYGTQPYEYGPLSGPETSEDVKDRARQLKQYRTEINLNSTNGLMADGRYQSWELTTSGLPSPLLAMLHTMRFRITVYVKNQTRFFRGMQLPACDMSYSVELHGRTLCYIGRGTLFAKTAGALLSINEVLALANRRDKMGVNRFQYAFDTGKIVTMKAQTRKPEFNCKIEMKRVGRPADQWDDK